jgi:hypothetical protein
MRLGIFALFLLFTGCGKIGDPLPPFIRIPEPINDLAVQQSGHDLILTWTNPSKNIDGSAVTDLEQIRILSDGGIVATADPVGPGKAQSFTLPISSLSSGSLTFTVQAQTSQGKLSEISARAAIMPVEVPGLVNDLRAVTDQRTITVEWGPPLEHPELAHVYLVSRSDITEQAEIAAGRQYIDARYEVGKTYTYQVRAVRRIADRAVPGAGPATVSVLAVDSTAPAVPSGLDISASDVGAFITWTPNVEVDLSGYRVFRAAAVDGQFIPIAPEIIRTNALFDPDYQPALYYAVSAVDEFGNESAVSAPFRAP